MQVYLDEVENSTGDRNQVLRINIPPPTLLHVNFESRKVALEKYWLLLENQSLGKPSVNGFHGFDPTEDTIFVSAPPSNATSQQQLINGETWSDNARDSIRFLAVNRAAWAGLNGMNGFVYFEKLGKFTLVVDKIPIYDLSLRSENGNLFFMDTDTEEEAYDHRLSIESQMNFDNGYYGRQWRLPTVEVKVVARREMKCTSN